MLLPNRNSWGVHQLTGPVDLEGKISFSEKQVYFTLTNGVDCADMTYDKIIDTIMDITRDFKGPDDYTIVIKFHYNDTELSKTPAFIEVKINIAKNKIEVISYTDHARDTVIGKWETEEALEKFLRLSKGFSRDRVNAILNLKPKDDESISSV